MKSLARRLLARRDASEASSTHLSAIRHGPWRGVCWLAAVATVLPTGLIPHRITARQTAQEAPFKGNLSLGGPPLFWDGEYVAQSRGGYAAVAAYFAAQTEDEQKLTDPCLTGSAYCRLYEIEVADAGGRLRVALDSSQRGDCFGLELKDPDGTRVPRERGFPGFDTVCPEVVLPQQYNLETSVPSAREGTWQIRVMAADVEDWAFRLRAVLEGARPREPQLLRPNLVAWAPWELGFVAAANPFAGSAIDRHNPAGPPGTSCHRDEAPASKCLRLSAGFYNIGDGPLSLVFRDEAPRDPDSGPGQAFQHVYFADGTPGDYLDNEEDGRYLERDAGPAAYHPSHGHRHFENMVLYELFSVAEGSKLTQIGKGAKHGWCAGPQQIRDWSGFSQDSHRASTDGSGRGACDTFMVQERGWGDPYRWQRPGQYVPYDRVADPDGTMRAGFYLVRVTVDPEDLLMETRENDNAAYAHIKVVDGTSPHSDRVVICERGTGMSPWDPKKQVLPVDPFEWAKLMKDRLSPRALRHMSP